MGKRKARPLTARGIEAIESDPIARREIPDGGAPGLYLVVQPSGAKSWAYRYRPKGKPEKVVLGKFPETSLASARPKAPGSPRPDGGDGVRRRRRAVRDGRAAVSPQG